MTIAAKTPKIQAEAPIPREQRDSAGRLEEAIDQKTARVGVIGLGYVGLPVALRLVDAGFITLGFDCDAAKIQRLEAGESYIGHIPGATIQSSIHDGRFRPTSDMACLSEADALLICVPTPLTQRRDPDLSHVVAAAKQIAAELRPGQLIVLESTIYPGATRGVVLPILETSGLKLGEDFFLAYSPEREDPGGHSIAAGNIPKLVGGMEPASQRLAAALYRHLTDVVVPVSSPEVAEAGKLLENTYRAVNIALVNEMKILFERIGIDIWEVIEAAKTKPFGFEAFYPGPGLGGHCIPIDPFYLSWLARTHGTSARFIELAGEVNRAMPQYVMQRVAEALNSRGKPLRGSKVCLLGVAYKRDVDDPRESPAFVLLEQLQAAGAVVSYHDPHIPRLPQMRHHVVPDLQSTPLSAEFLAEQDCLLIVTDHSAFDYEFIVQHAPLVVDARGATRNVQDHPEKIWPA